MSEVDATVCEVGGCSVRFTSRQTVLFVEPSGSLVGEDLPVVGRLIAQRARSTATSRVVLDIRAVTVLDRVFRDAVTAWAVEQPSPVVLVVPEELHAAEINMASLAQGALVRAFISTSDAFRYAARSTSKLGSETIDGSPPGSQRPLDRAQRRALLFPRRASEHAPPRPPRRD